MTVVSTLLLTYNEEANLPRCLEALRWCDDVLVLDSFSTDRTVAIAERYGARVIQRRFDDFATQRNHGLDTGGLRHEWVLHLDADELVTPALREEMLSRVVAAPEDAFRLASRLIFEGKWLRHAGMYPAYQVRLGRRDRLRFRQVGHGQRETLPLDRVGTLREPLVHHAFDKGMDAWMTRHRRYADDEARQALAEPSVRLGEALRWSALADPTSRRRLAKRLAARAPMRGPLRFAYMYLFRLGFLDGRAGMRYCLMMAGYESLIARRMRELRRGTP